MYLLLYRLLFYRIAFSCVHKYLHSMLYDATLNFMRLLGRIERHAIQMTAVYPYVRILSEPIAELPDHLYKYTGIGGKEKIKQTFGTKVAIKYNCN